MKVVRMAPRRTLMYLGQREDISFDAETMFAETLTPI
jgi:hypothetical protein